MTPIISPKLDVSKPNTGFLLNGYALGVPKHGQKSTLPTGLRTLVADKLRALMKVHGIETFKGLGDRIGVSRQTAQRLLECDHAADVDVLQAIGDSFNIDPAKIIEGKISQQESPHTTPPGVTAHSTKGNTPQKVVKVRKAKRP